MNLVIFFGFRSPNLLTSALTLAFHCRLSHERAHSTFTLLNEFRVFLDDVSVFVFLLPRVPDVFQEVWLDQPSPEEQNHRNDETWNANHDDQTFISSKTRKVRSLL
jgi:hypothetical protein